jgi:hypothetical protein
MKDSIRHDFSEELQYNELKNFVLKLASSLREQGFSRDHILDICSNPAQVIAFKNQCNFKVI